MSNTYQLNLPLVAGSQAQKHVTVNEALARLDAMAQMRLVSLSIPTPPSSPIDGQAYFVPIGADSDWSSYAGQIAIFANGGWQFVVPKVGWSAWVEDVSCEFVFNGGSWRKAQILSSPNGATSQMEILEYDHVITPGADNTTGDFIPAGFVIFAVSIKVTTEIVLAGATDYNLGYRFSAANFFGENWSTALGSVRSYSGAWPVSPKLDSYLYFTVNSGSFVSGSLQCSVHGMSFTPPTV